MGSIARKGEKRKSGRSHDAQSVPTIMERLRRDTPKLADQAAYADAVTTASQTEGRERDVLYFLANHADEAEEVEMGQQTLSMVFGLGRSRIERVLRHLRRLGKLEIVRRASWHRPNRYRITVPRGE